jgi:uncharacterized membrane protein YdjX (TVP38/TMEM64 family)
MVDEKMQQDALVAVRVESAQLSRRELAQNIFWLVIVLGVVYGFARLVGFEHIEARVAALGLFGPVLLALLKASTLVFAPLGGAPLYPIAGALFGFTKGLLIMTAGDIVGASVAFWISRRFGARIAAYFLSKPGVRAAEDVLHYLGTMKGIVQARIFFAGFPEAVHYAAGLTQISYLRYMVVNVAIGLVPTAILVALGRVLVERTSAFALVAASMVAAALGLFGAWWLVRQARRAPMAD